MSSVDNTFYMLSKTNNEDPNQSREMSNVGKSITGKYDKMVEDFEDLIEKRKVGGANGQAMSQSQMERRIPHYSQSKAQSQMVRPQRNTFQNEQYQNDHRQEIDAYNRIIQQQLNQNPNRGQRVTYAQEEARVIPADTNYDSDLNKYFDTEINDILDKIKKCKVEGVTDCDVNLGHGYKLMNCTNSLKKGQLEEAQLRRPLNEGNEPEYRQSTTEFREMELRRNTNKIREMFEDKDIQDLKNRSKAYTRANPETQNKNRSKTFQANLPENDQIRNLVNPEINRVGEFEGEIEIMKRKTIHETTPQESPRQSVDADRLSKPLNDGDTGRRSQNSGNFSFNPKNCKENMNTKMNEMIDQMDIDPVKKNVTVSMVMDDFDHKSPEELRKLRDKANTMGGKGKTNQTKLIFAMQHKLIWAKNLMR